MRRIPNRLLWLGHAGDARCVRELYSVGIRAVVELADSEQLAVLPRDFLRCRFPLSDDANNEPWLLRLAIGSIVELLAENVPTLVSCSAGMSRSLCIAAAALALCERRAFLDVLRETAGDGPCDVSGGLFQAIVQLSLTNDSPKVSLPTPAKR